MARLGATTRGRPYVSLVFFPMKWHALGVTTRGRPYVSPVLVPNEMARLGATTRGRPYITLYGLQKGCHPTMIGNFLLEQLFFVQFLGIIPEAQEMQMLCGGECFQFFLVFLWEP